MTPSGAHSKALTDDGQRSIVNNAPDKSAEFLPFSPFPSPPSTWCVLAIWLCARTMNESKLKPSAQLAQDSIYIFIPRIPEYVLYYGETPAEIIRELILLRN